MRDWLGVVLAIAGIALVAWSLTYGVGEGGGAGLERNGLLVAIASAPYLALVGARHFSRTGTGRFIYLTGLTALSLFWIWSFGGMVWWNAAPDAQDGLSLVLIPVMMAGLGILLLAATGLGEWIARRRLAGRAIRGKADAACSTAST
jgi:hypothetical protein